MDKVNLSYQERIRSMVTSAANTVTAKVLEEVQRGIHPDLRLFYKPCTETEDGSLLVCEQGNEPKGYLLGCTERFSVAIPYSHYWPWIRDRIGSLPLLAAS